MFIDCIRCKKCGNITIKPEDEEFFGEWDECMCKVNEILEETSFKTIEGHDCHPDAIECCGDCLKLNGYDVYDD